MSIHPEATLQDTDGSSSVPNEDGQAPSDRDIFTCTFAMNIAKFDGNPFYAETVFGRPQTIGRGDAFAEVDRLTEEIESLGDAPIMKARMTEPYCAALYERLLLMTEEERLQLDPIASSLKGMGITNQGEVLPNRIIALACIDLLKSWQKMVWNRP